MIEILVGIGLLVGMAVPMLYMASKKIVKRLKVGKYKANWQPVIHAGTQYGDKSSSTIYIRKNDYKKKGNYLWIEIGKVELMAENYQEKYNKLLEVAQDRAEFLNLEQNTYNYND